MQCKEFVLGRLNDNSCKRNTATCISDSKMEFGLKIGLTSSTISATLPLIYTRTIILCVYKSSPGNGTKTVSLRLHRPTSSSSTTHFSWLSPTDNWTSTLSCNSLNCVLFPFSWRSPVPSNWFPFTDAAQGRVTENTCHVISTHCCGVTSLRICELPGHKEKTAAVLLAVCCGRCLPMHLHVTITK